MRAATRNVVLKHIWQEPGTYRKRIASCFGLHPNAVSDVVRNLVSEKWVVEKRSGRSSVGRNPIGLHIHSGKVAVVVDYTGNTMSFGLIDAAGELLQADTISHNLREPEEIVELASRRIAGLEISCKEMIIGLAVADPGMIDECNGLVVRSSSFPAWRNVNIAGLFKAKTGMTTAITDTTRACAAAQYRALAGCRQARNSMLYIDYSEGRLGMALVTSCGTWIGNGYAGEIGHVVTDPTGSMCDCGTRGCLENEVGARALERNAATLLTRDVHSVMRNKSSMTAFDVFSAAKGGDRFARTVIHDTVKNLCFCAAVVTAMLHPRFVVVGAETDDAMGLLADDIRRTINTLVPAEISSTAEVMAGLPTIRLDLIGAGLMIFEKVINNK